MIKHKNHSLETKVIKGQTQYHVVSNFGKWSAQSIYFAHEYDLALACFERCKAGLV